MKRILLISIVITTLVPGINQTYGQNWKADLKVISEFYIQQTEVNVSMIVDLYHDGELIDPEPDFRYDWYRYYPLTDTSIWRLHSTKYGINTSGTHTYQDSTIVPYGKFDLYCKITIPSESITVRDDIVIAAGFTSSGGVAGQAAIIIGTLSD